MSSFPYYTLVFMIFLATSTSGVSKGHLLAYESRLMKMLLHPILSIIME